MGRIFYLMGKSASGKDTLYKRLLEECPWLKQVVLYTTRPMREGESDGIEYHFVTPGELAGFERQGKVIESRTYQTVCGPWTYATVDDGQINPQAADYLAIGTLESYERVRAYFGEAAVVPLYVTVDDGTRLIRAIRREQTQKAPNYAELCRRYLADESDFSPENLRRLSVTRPYPNDDLDTCLTALKAEITRPQK